MFLSAGSQYVFDHHNGFNVASSAQLLQLEIPPANP
tara:strand:- start:5211 stop:5318 length:108 start_codon:yes stop_codon:yes gene_type:complete